MPITGIVLAAGQGRRMGTPKALISDARGSWLTRAVVALRNGGCSPVVVVLGASSDEAARLVQDAEIVVADDWHEGMSASLRAGLHACPDDADAALITLVDLPDVDHRVVSRVMDAAGAGARRALVRATFDGTPGHPVVIGRHHWASALDRATGDQGARALFANSPHVRVECADLATGRDIDTREELERA
ncbi:NTP transferase domain-containing protein [Yimella sp. cx-51]|uniref:nucleotidyltransferase family protein n=1 Tax=Yimella sp. cx-51 TaxID=2770551 RepID=UPI00165DBE2A|nr:nucleotidyltransferase family protein [Yimella sp. cx-51]MBC9957808.1 nucleotidyltransferase family protein [Yimella sp. cx-51]QTH36850.1 nucleotidyltransferase family protein [Yimella sp. cx-51]